MTTTHKAKKILKTELDRLGLGYDKLTARTVNFSDLARSSAVFVRIHEWKPGPAWSQLQAVAKSHGFFIET